MAWTTEWKLFSNPPTALYILHITLKPSSHILILKHIIYYTAVDQYATDSRPIFHQQSTDIPPTIDTPHISQVTTRYTGHVSADTPFIISVECTPTYRSTCQPIQWSRVNQYLANTLIDISADSVNQYLIKRCTNYTRSAFLQQMDLLQQKEPLFKFLKTLSTWHIIVNYIQWLNKRKAAVLFLLCRANLC